MTDKATNTAIWQESRRAIGSLGERRFQIEVLGDHLALERVEYQGIKGDHYQISLYTPGGSQHRPIRGADEAGARAAWATLLAQPRCRECGDPEPGEYMEPTQTQMRERGLCCGCNFWTNRLAVLGPNSATVGGISYEIERERPDLRLHERHVLGHGGAAFEVEFFDGRRVRTTNLWSCGEVPKHFRGRIPDNARFVARALFSAYTGHGSASR